MLKHCLLTFTSLAVFGCAGQSPPPQLYRYTDLVRSPEVAVTAFKKPFILELQPGDRLPVELTFRDQYLSLEPDKPALALVAKQRCYVRVDDRGVRLSPDLQSFDREEKAPGAFAVGFDRDAAVGPLLRVQVHTPRR